MRIIDDLGDHYENNKDFGDHRKTFNVVCNVCLTPDPESSVAMAYSEQIIAASQELARRGRTCYTLCEKPGPSSTIDSHVHATVSHVVINSPLSVLVEAPAFFDALKPLMGFKIELPVWGLLYYVGKPFDRLAKATGGEMGRVDPNIEDRVFWGQVGLTEEYKKLREAVEEVVKTSSKGAAVCIGARGDNCLPHHTSYVERVTPGATGDYPTLPWNMVPKPVKVPHVLSLGTCGPWGQVTEKVIEPRQIRDFLYHNVCRLGG